jgi:hypothetical protein
MLRKTFQLRTKLPNKQRLTLIDWQIGKADPEQGVNGIILARICRVLVSISQSGVGTALTRISKVV